MQVNLIPDEYTRYEIFISKFNILKESSEELLCSCPSCGKDKLYISYSEVKNKPGTHTMLLDCKHGCKCKEILAAAGLEPKDLYLTQFKRPPSWKDCADIRSHEYKNADGSRFARKDVYKFHTPCVTDKKTYYPGEKQALWYLYDPNEKSYNKKSGLNKRKIPLYHLDRIGDKKTILIPEGEKDVETLEKLGYAATTNGGGASENWKNAGYAKYLKDAEAVYVLCDNDDPGRERGIKVGNYLQSSGIPCKIIHCTDIYADSGDKWDITDIYDKLGAEKTKELLDAAILKAGDFTPQPEIEYIQEQPQQQRRLTQLILEKYLADHFIALKINAITHKICVISEIELKEYKPHSRPEVLPVWLYDRLQNDYKNVTVEGIQRFISAIAMKQANEFNPPLEKIDSTVWDKQPRFPALCEMLSIPLEDKLSRTLLMKWLMQSYCILHNTVENAFSADGVLVFIGAQGFGKTRLLEKLALGRDNFGEGRCYDPHNKDSNIQVTTKWITELGEIGSTMRKDTDMLKAFLSSSTDEYRAPYGRTAITYPRRTSFCGSTNDKQFLIDETGNRRFWTIELDNTKYIDINGPTFKNFDVPQLWAEVKYAVEIERENGKTYASCFRLTHNEIKALELRNRDHAKLLKGEQEVLDILTRFNDIAETETVTITEFRMRYPELKGYTSLQIGKVLNKLGYEQKFIKKDGITARAYALPLGVTYRGNDNIIYS